MSTELTVVDRRTGVVLDVRNAETEELADFHIGVDELKGELSDAAAIVNAELVRRLDRNASWTERVLTGAGDNRREFEIKAPSPNAGTTTYPPRDLEQELRALVTRDVISEAGACKALTRQIVVTLEVPLDVDLEELRDLVAAQGETEIAGRPVRVVGVEAVRKSVTAGINALRKINGTGAALDRVKETLPVGSRRATVKVKTLEEARR